MGGASPMASLQPRMRTAGFAAIVTERAAIIGRCPPPLKDRTCAVFGPPPHVDFPSPLLAKGRVPRPFRDARVPRAPHLATSLPRSPCATTSNRGLSSVIVRRWSLRTARSGAPTSMRCPRANWTLLVQGVNLHCARRRCAAAPVFVPAVRAARRRHGQPGRPRRRCRAALRLVRRFPAARRRAAALALRPPVGSRAAARASAQDPPPLQADARRGARPRRHAVPAAVVRARRHGRRRVHDLFDRLSRARCQRARDGVPRLASRRARLAGRYADADLRASGEPARIGATMQRRCATMLASIRWDRDDADRFLGTYLSEPKPTVFFSPPAPALSFGSFRAAARRHGVRLDRARSFLYDDRRLFINGLAQPWPAAGAPLLRRLANERALPATALAHADAGDGPAVVRLVSRWLSPLRRLLTARLRRNPARRHSPR